MSLLFNEWSWLEGSGGHTPIAGGIQIVNINLHPQRDCKAEEKVCFQDVGHLVTARGQGLAHQPHPVYIKNSCGSLSTPPPPSYLEDYPAQPEALGDGQTTGYALRKFPTRDLSIPGRGTRNEFEDCHN